MKKRLLTLALLLVTGLAIYAGTFGKEGLPAPTEATIIAGKDGSGNTKTPKVNSNGSIDVNAVGSALPTTGAANVANGQITTSGSAATLVSARSTRRSVSITNTDSVIVVYIGAATVTTANGKRLDPKQSISVDTTALIQVIAASGTPVVDYIETYD